MTYTKKQLPKYCKHKSSGRAYVRIGGKMYYLGKHGSQASRREYDRIIAEFLVNGRQTLCDPEEIRVEHLILRFMSHMKTELNYSDGAQTRMTRVFRELNELYGTLPVTKFTPTILKTIRHRQIDGGLCKDTINGYINTIKQVFSWGCEEEIVPAEIAGALRTVRSLQTGRSAAVEYEDVEPVPDDVVEKTLPHLRPAVQDMVRVQRLIGGRPQDVRNMRFCDIDRSGAIWKYAPFTHKTKKLGKIRELAIGPRAQQILLLHLDRCKDAPDQFIFTQQNGKQYTDRNYIFAVAAACKRAGVPAWTPNQLRHAGGTEVRDKFGLEYAQAVLGHANAKTTEIYAKASFEKAAKVAREIG